MDNREAIKIIRNELNAQLHYQQIVKIRDYSDPREYKRRLAHLHAVKALNNKLQWIPVETRDMTEEEKKEMFETWEYCTESDCWKYDCPLPEDGQEILVSTKWGVSLDTFCVDEGCWFENHPDRGEVLAWMPLPEPYKVGGVK